jgi:hypothetical protein
MIFMRILLAAPLVLSMFSFAWSQESELCFAARPNDVETVSVDMPVSENKQLSAGLLTDSNPFAEAVHSTVPNALQEQKEVSLGDKAPDCCKPKEAKKIGVPPDEIDDPDPIAPKEKFHWKPALIQSLAFAGFQNAFRVIGQEKTRRELGGPFFRDWGRSVASLRGWRDGDKFVTNYVAHPLQGAFTGRIFVNHSERARKEEFGTSKKYWETRMKALAWSAAWSVQFELGPISEATIGNVGTFKENGYNTMAYVDLVVTPVIGTAVLVGEEALDKYLLKNWIEKKTSSKFKIRLLRSLLTPTTSIGNLVNWKVPWKRYNRPL